MDISYSKPNDYLTDKVVQIYLSLRSISMGEEQYTPLNQEELNRLYGNAIKFFAICNVTDACGRIPVFDYDDPTWRFNPGFHSMDDLFTYNEWEKRFEVNIDGYSSIPYTGKNERGRGDSQFICDSTGRVHQRRQFIIGPNRSPFSEREVVLNVALCDDEFTTIPEAINDPEVIDQVRLFAMQLEREVATAEKALKQFVEQNRGKLPENEMAELLRFAQMAQPYLEVPSFPTSPAEAVSPTSPELPRPNKFNPGSLPASSGLAASPAEAVSPTQEWER